MRSTWRVGMVGLGLAMGLGAAWGQAAALPSVQVPQRDEAGRGRELMDAMVAALGGDAWLNRQTWVVDGTDGDVLQGRAGWGGSAV